jgi:divinyl protochlorophyllide a 8-vinyl-reductase
MGPNAIIQTVHALNSFYGESQTSALLERGGHAHLLDNLPTEMINEAEFHALVQMLVAQAGAMQAAQILYDAGQRTAAYLLTHRIPGFFQRLVSILPRRAGLSLLLWAIGRNAWTFVGSGTFRFAMGHHPAIHIRVNYPSVSPVASVYGGTFAHLTQTLIDRHITIQTTTTYAAGGIDCTYTLTLV